MSTEQLQWVAIMSLVWLVFTLVFRPIVFFFADRKNRDEQRERFVKRLEKADRYYLKAMGKRGNSKAAYLWMEHEQRCAALRELQGLPWPGVEDPAMSISDYEAMMPKEEEE